MSTSDFQCSLLAWGRGRRTHLPWRRHRTPWRVLVSETMLQQTQAARVARRFEAFVTAFPTPATLAAAPVAAAVRHWQGLGYNRRAVHLHRTAEVIVAQHGGEVPDELDALLALPGVGPYTARAVLSLAFEHDVAAIDTNVGRVLARAVAGHRLSRAAAQQLGDDIVPSRQGRPWNQTVMDLGALVCTKRSPNCPACPVRSFCRWAVTGWPEPDPADRSAGVSRRQAPFEGSDRQGRGRLVDALRTGPVPFGRIPDVAGWPDEPERALRVAESLVDDGLAEVVGGTLALPA